MALLDYLAGRRVEIEAQIKSLKGELAEIRIAESALMGAPVGKTVVSSPQGPAVVREGSIKDWVLKALVEAPSGLETERIIEAVGRAGGPRVPRNSMTPQLSRLKAAGLIDLQGRYWQLPRAAENDETPDGYQPSDASESGEDDYSDLA